MSRSFTANTLVRCDATTYGPSSEPRFLSVDPLAALSGDRYGYAANDPLSLTDPSGLYWGEGLVHGVVNFGHSLVCSVVNGLASLASAVESSFVWVAQNPAVVLKVAATTLGVSALLATGIGLGLLPGLLAASGLTIAGAGEAATTFGVLWTVAAVGLTTIQCRTNGFASAQCLADIAATLGGGVATWLGAVGAAAEQIVPQIVSGIVGLADDVVSFFRPDRRYA